VPNSSRILIVEDDRDSLAALFTFVLQSGYSPLTAESGQQAIDLLERGVRPCCLLIDLMLPKVSGYAVIDYLRGDPVLKTIPVIVITAVSREDLKPLVVDAILHKPLDYGALLDAIRNCARSSV
jgi:CheY-like chemotaxis protein